MAKKKERGRFTIKLNENDSAQEAAIRLLERQPPRTKAQLIANALLHYGNCPAAAATAPQGVNRDTIKEIVRETLSQIQRMDRPPDVSCPTAGQLPGPGGPMREPLQNQQGIAGVGTAVDGEAFSMIADTLTAFRGG